MAWTLQGITDLKHLLEKIWKHNLETHIGNICQCCVKLTRLSIFFVRLSAVSLMKVANRNSLYRHSEWGSPQIMEWIKFLGGHKLATGRMKLPHHSTRACFWTLLSSSLFLDSQLADHLFKLQIRDNSKLAAWLYVYFLWKITGLLRLNKEPDADQGKCRELRLFRQMS